jgi:hypothetical protein
MFSLKFRLYQNAGFLLLAVSLSQIALAKKAVHPRHHFTVIVQGKYSTQWTKVFKKGDKWVCQTDLMPYAEAQGDPFADLNWSMLAKEAKRKTADCRDKVRLIDSRGLHTKTLSSCLSLPLTKSWVDKISRACGRY